MSRVEEIQAAIETLSCEEHLRLVEWFREREQTRWDEQMDEDNASGKLDRLFAKAEKDIAEGRVLPWPPE